MSVWREPPPGEPSPGISHQLARWRSAHFDALRYGLDLHVEEHCERLSGRLRFAWRFRAAPVDVILDWRPSSTHPGVTGLKADGVDVPMQTCPDHLIVAAEAFTDAGEHVIELAFEAPIAEASTALTRYRDREDGSDYLYTLLVPADASALFPCMDQPDLKAVFELTLTLPAGWCAISNAPLEAMRDWPGGRRLRFAPTPPLSTYLFAFAAGPFEALHDGHGDTRLFVRSSQRKRADAHAAEVLRLNRAGVHWFSEALDCPFPFAKYDLVLIPEFAYAGMEHAGATFLREDSVLFVAEPGEEDVLRRAQLIFHEAAHQWFGDLVTMRWFDDLWLKEGFANLMAYQAARALLPDIDARIAWHRSKEIAYRTDVTCGTTAVRQPLVNLAWAKAAYGNVVYHKAPAVLHLAETLVGERAFRAAMRAFLARHAWSTAEWTDLVAALERVSGCDLGEWARDWVLQPGMPHIACDWTVDGQGRLASLTLNQRPVQAAASEVTARWPQRTVVALGRGGRTIATFTVDAGGDPVRLDQVKGLPAPDWVFANAEDRGYGWFELDARSREFLLQHLPRLKDGFLRALLWDALWQAVRDAQIAPEAWVDLLLRGLPAERDELTVPALLGALEHTLRWYLEDAGRQRLQARCEDALREAMLSRQSVALRVACFRAFVTIARSPEARDDCAALLDGRLVIPAVPLRSADRFRVSRTLIAQEDARGEYWRLRLAAEGSDDARRMAFAAEAARPSQSAKTAMFGRLLDGTLPERWVEEAVTVFNTVEHDSATLPHLESALRALPRLSSARRIFFANHWLAAFVGGQRSAQALSVIDAVLDDGRLPDSLQRKLREARDGLERTVRVRGRFGGAGGADS